MPWNRAMDYAVAVYEFIARKRRCKQYRVRPALSIAGATSNAAAYALMQKVDPGNPLR
jgi:hypothetical protein